MKRYGHIALSRKQFNGEDLLWDDGTPFDTRSAWTWIIQAAAWKEGTYHTAFRLDELKRGEFVASLRYLGDRWKWDKMRVQRFLELLKTARRIKRQRKGHHGTVYLLVNYGTYNVDRLRDETASETPNETGFETVMRQRRDKVEEVKEREERNTLSYPADFELLWRAYPKRSGSNNKQKAHRQYLARLAEGVSFQVMYDGVLRYAKWAQSTGKVGTELVQMSSTFLGRDRHFEESWETPDAAVVNGDDEAAVLAALGISL